MNKKTNIQLIFSICLGILAVGGFIYAAYYINGLTEKTSLLREEIENKEIKIKRIQRLNTSADKTKSDRAMLLNYFVKPNGAIDFVSSLEETASNFNLEYSTNAIENIEAEVLASQDKQLLRIGMSLSGGWKNITKYILYIESLPYPIRVEKLELVSEGVVTKSVPAESSLASSTSKIITVKPIVESKWKLGITFSTVMMKK